MCAVPLIWILNANSKSMTRAIILVHGALKLLLSPHRSRLHNECNRGLIPTSYPGRTAAKRESDGDLASHIKLLAFNEMAGHHNEQSQADFDILIVDAGITCLLSNVLSRAHTNSRKHTINTIDVDAWPRAMWSWSELSNALSAPNAIQGPRLR